MLNDDKLHLEADAAHYEPSRAEPYSRAIFQSTLNCRVFTQALGGERYLKATCSTAVTNGLTIPIK